MLPIMKFDQIVMWNAGYVLNKSIDCKINYETYAHIGVWVDVLKCYLRLYKQYIKYGCSNIMHVDIKIDVARESN